MNTAKTDISYRMHDLACTLEDQATGEEIERGANEIDRLRGLLREARTKLTEAPAVRSRLDFAGNLLWRIDQAIGSPTVSSTAGHAA